ncbi:MAG: hypothetical protein LQ338_007724 [Usnochroma carphineum]|nr:MAG: hypothetical protein LQ338_007724 [Usnochroma carphineum]
MAIPSVSARQVLDKFYADYHAAVIAGEYQPFVWPYRTLGPYLVVGYLLLPPTHSRIVYLARYPLFALICYLSVTTIRECRSPAVTVGYGIGLLNAWSILWSATLLIFNDGRRDYQRIERQERPYTSPENNDSLVENVQGETSALDGSTKDDLRSLHPLAEVPQSTTTSSQDPETDYPEVFAAQEPPDHNETYIWQSLPASFLHRLDYILDLVTNFRGLRFTHQSPYNTLPPPPHIRSSLPSPSPPPSLPTQHYPTRRTLFTKNLVPFLLCSLALDILKYLTSLDPYFSTLPPSIPSPFPYPRTTRLLLSLLFTYCSLLNIFLLAPLLLACALGPSAIGAHASTWLYPPYFGPLSSIPEKGLAGLWGGWWHQLFRYAFESAGDFVAGKLLRLRKNSPSGSAARVFVAFCCSGVLHACASYTILGPTHPIRNSFAFFAVQPFGIVGQRALSVWLKENGYREAVPLWMRKVGNVVVVVAWCLWTGPWIADEFARGGIWMYEPLPVSLVRGVKGEGWWRWGGEWVRWETGDRWWRSGLTFMGG